MPDNEVVFAGRYFRRVTETNLSTWLKFYHALDRDDALAALQAGDDYYAEEETPPKKWFFQASAWLKREHDHVLRRAKDEDENDPYAGVLDWREPEVAMR